MPGGNDTPGEARPGELRVVGTSVTREIDQLFDRLAQSTGRRAPRVLQVGSRTLVSERNVRNWRSLVARRFGAKARFVGLDIAEGSNVDCVADICGDPRMLKAKLGEEPFDLVLCCHVLEHTRHPARAARNIERALRPGGLAYVAAAWSQAFHATPDDYWRFSARGLMLLFGRLEIQSSFYSGGDVGLDVAYRIERDGRPELDARAGAVEQGLFQLVLDHEDNRGMLARQATERLPVSRTYLPSLFVNLVGRRLR
ncbi:methyltransferase domain-containing protein [Reyranella aquatilis]|jgi:SAM-dependent methyltransferase|uniref:Class I SAM-dependent methyltransferase n=1 Tax=Reyranella aquatilis TaxID=2035356 RepID=A0ABS8KSQ1_9HYPH|nr:methyltransferase domain-containing protein [Reyranella aquatilis]MCC8429112.1 class I SAM-dependent methyltransferase [Reyranella aquatilis]